MPCCTQGCIETHSTLTHQLKSDNVFQELLYHLIPIHAVQRGSTHQLL